MKRNITVLVLFIAFSAIVAAQPFNRAVESISARYAEIAEKARLCETDDDRGQFGELFMNELVVNKRDHQWRAVGIHRLTYKFFYKGGNAERRMYPDQLVFVKTERRESNRTYIEDYLYSEAGVLLFYFHKAENDDQAPTERRVYFSGLKAIRVVEDGKIRDRIGPKDEATVKDFAKQSKKIRELFTRSTVL